MCGIVGYIGNKNATDIIYDGLKKLEYRGYDSAGIAVIDHNIVKTNRSTGKLVNLKANLEKNPIAGNIGIGHTRWATHGKPSEENAHPHTDCSGKIVVVHNGIIENYISLKKQLVEEGHKFDSETDTEVVAHLIEKNYHGNILEATKKALKQVRGTYALAVICGEEPDKIIVSRNDAPLVIGVGSFRCSGIACLCS